MKLKQLFALILAFAIVSASANSVTAASAVPWEYRLGSGIVKGLARKAVVGGAVAAAGAGLLYGQRGEANVSAYVRAALQNWGTALGEDAVEQAAAEMNAHRIVGRRAAVAALNEAVANDPSLGSAANALADRLGIQSVHYKEEARVQTLPAVRETAHEDDDACESVEALEQERYKPGIATGGYSLPDVHSGAEWWFGSQGNAARIPRKVADVLRHRPFKDFDGFRGAIWTEIGDDPILSQGFNESNKSAMRNGNAPFAPPTQRRPGQPRYHIHHIKPIARGGDVYNFDNLWILSPLCHNDILDKKYHYGRSK